MEGNTRRETQGGKQARRPGAMVAVEKLLPWERVATRGVAAALALLAALVAL